MTLDPSIAPWLVYTHLAAATVALGAAPLAMAVRKGGAWHRLWGRIFFFAMAVVCATSIGLAALDDTAVWFALCGLFSFHLVATGYRSLYLKRLYQGQRAAWPDLLIHLGAGAVYSGMVIWGVAHMALRDRTTPSLLILALGVAGTLCVVGAVRKFFLVAPDKREWLYGHINGMLGGYVAVVSTWSALNLDMLEPAWLRWVWPMILGLPLLAIVPRYYRKRFEQGRRMRDMADVRIP